MCNLTLPLSVNEKERGAHYHTIGMNVGVGNKSTTSYIQENRSWVLINSMNGYGEKKTAENMYVVVVITN